MLEKIDFYVWKIRFYYIDIAPTMEWDLATGTDL